MDPSSQSDLMTLATTQDAGLRNAAALRLADARVPEAKAVLVGLILTEDLRNHRGTLVYCLGHFDCSDQFGLLIGLVISGNFEVACGALHILESLEGVSGEQAQLASEALEDALVKTSAEDWRRELLDGAFEMFD